MIKGKSLTGGQAAIKSLKKEKVKHVFGLIGSATMEMFVIPTVSTNAFHSTNLFLEKDVFRLVTSVGRRKNSECP